MSVPRSRLVLAVLVLGGLGFALAATTWLSVRVPTVLELVDVAVPGTDAVPAVGAASLAVLAAALAVAIGGRVVATLGGLALVGTGALLTVSSARFVLDPDPVALSAAAEVSGVREIAGDVAITFSPYATVVVGVLVAAAGVVVVLAARSWTAGGRRFERAGSDAPASASTVTRADGGARPDHVGAGSAGSAATATAAPSSGAATTPTAAPSSGAGAAPTAAPSPGALDATPAPDTAGAARLRAMDDWDALGRGEDPSAPDAG